MSGFKKFLSLLSVLSPLCNYGRKNPFSLLGKFVKWHSKWCPCYKARDELIKEKF